MTYFLKQAGRATALWVAMIFGTILSGILVRPAPHPGVPDGPLTAFAAMLLVTGLGAVIVAGIAALLTLRGLRKAACLFVIFFALETGLSLIEAATFKRSLGLTSADLRAIACGGLIRASATAAFATLLWRRAAAPAIAISPNLSRLAAVVILYVSLYFAAGMLIAWRSEAVRDFYHSGVDINLPELVVVQIGRGILWTSLALLFATKLRGGVPVVAAWTAAAFAVIMAAPLIYPNALMPWAVRQVHLVELAASNAAFGFVAVLILRGWRRIPITDERPQSGANV